MHLHRDGGGHDLARGCTRDGHTGRAELMVNLDYKADQAFEVTPAMTNAEVNDVLKVSDRVVFFAGGSYPG